MTEQTVSVDQTQGALRASTGDVPPGDCFAVAYFKETALTEAERLQKAAWLPGGAEREVFERMLVMVNSIEQAKSYAQFDIWRELGSQDKAIVALVLNKGEWLTAAGLDLAWSVGVANPYYLSMIPELISALHTKKVLCGDAVRKPQAPKPQAQNDAEFRHFLGKVRDAARGGRDAWSVQSTGEKVAVALALSKFDWLSDMAYTLPEAIERTGPTWCALMPAVSRALRDSGDL